MKIILDNETTIDVSDMSFGDWRKFMREFMSHSKHSNKVWDLMSCVRGPDFPSEKPSMSASEYKRAYDGRRARKYETTEVIRAAMFFGVVGGSARHHKSDYVILPSESDRDHFDRHVAMGARLLGLNIKEK